MEFHSELRPLQTSAEALATSGLVIERIRELGKPDPGDKMATHRAVG